MNREDFRKKNSLSKEKYSELKRRYYETNENTAYLIDEFGLVGIKPSQLYLFFDDVITEERCPYCGGFMKHLPLSRQSKDVNRVLKCSNCDHKYSNYRYELCECDGCIKQRKYEIWKFFQTEHSIDFGVLDELTFFERLYLGALHFYGRDEEKKYIFPYNEQKNNLSFWEEDENELFFNILYEKGFLVVSPDSVIENFRFDRNNKFELDEGFILPPYELWLDKNDILKLEKGEILGRLNKLNCWQKVNQKEVGYYLTTIFENNHIQNYNRERVQRIIGNYCAEFSLAEIFSMIKHVMRSDLFDMRLKKIEKKTIRNRSI